MKITVVGTGYVGLVTGVCFAEMGHDVHNLDIDEKKIQQLNLGKSPIYEPGLSELIDKNLKLNRIHFSTGKIAGIHNSDIIFITVGSPADQNGLADLSLVINAIESIANAMETYKLIIIKSTVPVGSLNIIETKITNILKTRKLNILFDVASNPEFLREGSAIDDCLNPDRIVVGCSSKKAIALLQEIYQPLLSRNIPFLVMDSNSAEMTKYASNCMLAAKISLMNEFSRMCEKLGANIDFVRQGVGADHRIGEHSLFAGLGYGGSCFPKDIEAMIKIGLLEKEDLKIISAVAETNHLQLQRFLSKISARLPDLENKHIAIWGVAFKPNTDDVRDAPSLGIIESLLAAKAQINIFDPAATENLKLHFNNNKNLHFFSDPYLALKDVQALIIPTEWPIFTKPDFNSMRNLMANNLIFDGRNIYSLADMKQNEFEYYSVGRSNL